MPKKVIKQATNKAANNTANKASNPTANKTTPQSTQAHHPEFPSGPYPIIFIRGFAFGEDAIEATTNTPFMGFNLGSTKDRQLWTGEIIRLHFASPLIRLMEDHHYRAIETPSSPNQALDPRSILIHRYYDPGDPADPDPDTTPPTILKAAHDLQTLIDHLHTQYTLNPQPWDEHHIPFGVHLVAHSMGGLIARTLLQHPDLKHSLAAQSINKVFTYATPHGGITLGGFEMPRFIQLQNAHHFHKKHLAKLFNAPRADDLNNDFPTERFFSLIGTNHQDYRAGRGLAKRLAGPLSDGLVQIKRAAVKHSPRAHIHRTHGGPFGIVNSEAGYHNLVRFLFGRLRLDAHLELQALPLPFELQTAKDQGHRINASYWIEASLAPRPNPHEGERAPVYLTERRKANHSAIFRGYDEIMHPERLKPSNSTSAKSPQRSNLPTPPTPRHPILFSAFLDPRHSADQQNLVLSLELKVSATDYAIDGQIHPEYSLAGQTLYQDTLKLTFSPQNPDDAAEHWSQSPTLQHSTPEHPTTDHPISPAPIQWNLTVASITEPSAQPLPIHPLQNPNPPSKAATQAFKVGLSRGPQGKAHDHAFRADLILKLQHR